MKKFLSLILTLILLINIVPVAFASGDVKVTLNGKQISFDQPPVIIDGRILVPIRAVCEKLGADVYWHEPSQAILVVKNEIKLALSVGENQMVKFTVGSFSEYLEKAEDINFKPEEVYLDVPPQIIGDRTLLPIRVICEALGAQVDWNGETNTVTITCSEEITNDKNMDKTFFDDFMAYVENQIKEQEKGLKEEYSDFYYTTTITIEFSDPAQLAFARKIIETKLNSEGVERYTFDFLKENSISVTFGFNEGFDIDGFYATITKEIDQNFTGVEQTSYWTR